VLGRSAAYTVVMPRRLREATGGLAYHVLNRAAGRARLFAGDADYAAFERVLGEAWMRTATRIVCYCIMPNHWHLVLWPKADGELSDFMHWLTVTHTQRWHAYRNTVGTGPLYQGRFKSFPIQQDHHFLRVCRYVERNALRAGLVTRAEDWRWGSLGRRRPAATPSFLMSLSDWPVAPPRNWTAAVNRVESEAELPELRRSVQRGTPFGDEAWQSRTAAELGLESSLRARGRPRRSQEA
jgi:putative transposase